MLASPGFTPGRGEGTAASSTDRPSANAAMRAMWWSSEVVESFRRNNAPSPLHPQGVGRGCKAAEAATTTHMEECWGEGENSCAPSPPPSSLEWGVEEVFSIIEAVIFFLRAA